MARIAGIDIPKNKKVLISLTYIYGIGKKISASILKETEISPETKTDDLTQQDVSMLRSHIEKALKVEGDLRKDMSMNIKRLMDIGTYRGTRHKRSLPVRGQRTSTNARTRKGPKKTAGSGRRKEQKK